MTVMKAILTVRSKRQKIDGEEAMTKEEVDFLTLLEDELEKFNTFFVEKEEEYIIRLKELQDRVAKAKVCNYEEMLKIRKEIVDFHGEMVLLENYSALNYTEMRANYSTYQQQQWAAQMSQGTCRDRVHGEPLYEEHYLSIESLERNQKQKLDSEYVFTASLATCWRRGGMEEDTYS
ncbi:SPX domain-containing protein 2 [Bienertia sinuspersici]